MRFQNIRTKKGFFYILTNYNRNVLYIGVTSNLIQRIWKHRNGKGSSFTKKYKLKYLVHFKAYENIQLAIQREKQLKNWHRDWKYNLIRDKNPTLEDLWPIISHTNF